MSFDTIKGFFTSRKKKMYNKYKEIGQYSIPIDHIVRVQVGNKEYKEGELTFECPIYQYFVLSRKVNSLSKDVLNFRSGTSDRECKAVQVTGEIGEIGMEFKGKILNIDRNKYAYDLWLTGEDNVYCKNLHGTAYEEVLINVNRYFRNHNQRFEGLTHVDGEDLLRIAIEENQANYEKSRKTAMDRLKLANVIGDSRKEEEEAVRWLFT